MCIVIDGETHELCKSEHNVFTGKVTFQALPFSYSLRIKDRHGNKSDYPDPKSVYLPNGVHGPSEILRSEFPWTDDEWSGISKSDLVIYELHIGTFSQEGTFDGCRRQLDYLVELGINAIELMPLAQCPGRWNWGYDGVGLFAVNHNYGTPDDLKRLINDCHANGISVIHDVVYNHVGPEGNYLGVFGNYFSKKHGTPWGSAFDFDGPNKNWAREFVVQNALYWLEEFHFDGLRLDAIHFMFDDSEYSIQQEVCDRIRKFESKANRSIHLIGEANIYDHELILAGESKRNTYCAIWADDLMHSIYSVANAGEHLTPREYSGANDLEEALTNGYLYQGPVMKRVTSDDRNNTHGGDPVEHQNYLDSLIVALQTHDSVGNHPQGKRIHQLTSLEFQKAAAPLMLLYPAIPMIFMGEEFASDAPFMFFADFIDQRLRKSVDRGRKREYPHHDWSNSIAPSDKRAFEKCKLILPDTNNETLQWYRDLIRLRKNWRSKELLGWKNMEIVCLPEQQLFAITYRSTNGNSFIVSRLGSQIVPDFLKVQIENADIQLEHSAARVDQQSVRAGENIEYRMYKNHVIIGLGDLKIDSRQL